MQVCVRLVLLLLVITSALSGGWILTFSGIPPGEDVGNFYAGVGVSMTGFTVVLGGVMGLNDQSARVSPGAILNSADGITLLSFYLDGGPMELEVYSGAWGSGALLDTARADARGPWDPLGLFLPGAHSIRFSFDSEVTLPQIDSVTNIDFVVPEPGTRWLALLLLPPMLILKRLKA